MFVQFYGCQNTPLLEFFRRDATGYLTLKLLSARDEKQKNRGITVIKMRRQFCAFKVVSLMRNNYAMLEEITSQITLRIDVKWFLLSIRKPLFIPTFSFRV